MTHKSPSTNPRERNDPWSLADTINNKTIAMRDFARILAMAGSSINSDEGVAINTVAWDLVNRAQHVNELVEELQKRLGTSADDNAAPAA